MDLALVRLSLEVLLGCVIFGFFVDFSRRFIGPAARVRQDLRSARQDLIRLKQQATMKSVPPDDADEVMRRGHLDHLWSEYKETLHGQTVIDHTGTAVVQVWRATTPAESLFTHQAAVLTPIRADYFQHLPGILTGIGIIGTFLGLILGLGEFSITEDPASMRTSLRSLLEGVRHAFYVSAGAIVVAMVCTGLEKWLLASLNEEWEKLCQEIDKTYDAGVGEEYLSRLVSATETSATQAIQLKDALVTDLKQILLEISERQMETAMKSTMASSEAIARSITGSLAEPIGRISSAVERVGENQGEAVHKLLGDMLSSFSAQVQGALDGQSRGLVDGLNETAAALTTAMARFEQSSHAFESAGQAAASTLAGSIEASVRSLAEGQSLMLKDLAAMAGSIREASVSAQQASTDQASRSVHEIAGQMSAFAAALTQQARDQSLAMQAEVARIQETVGSLASRIESVVVSSGSVLAEAAANSETERRMAAEELSREMRDAITRLSNGVTEQVDACKRLQTETAQEVARQITSVTDELTRRAAAQALASEAHAETVNSRTEELLARLQSSVLASQQTISAGIISAEAERVRSSERLSQETAATIDRLIAAVGEQSSAQGRAMAQQQTEFLGRVELLMAHQNEAVVSSSRQFADAAECLRKGSDAMASLSREGLTQLNAGASAAGNALASLAAMHDRIGALLPVLSRVSDGFAATSGMLERTSVSLSGTAANVDDTAAMLQQATALARETVETARRDAGVTSQLVEKLAGAAAILQKSNDQTVEHLRELQSAVSDVHDEFAREAAKSLQTVNREFHGELARAVAMLSATIGDLDGLLSAINPPGDQAPAKFKARGV